MSKRIAVVGAGSWGTALAQVLATAGSQVVMWARKPEVADGITNEHRNPRYLSDSVLLPSITATTSIAECITGSDAVLVVTPSSLMRKFATDMAPYLGSEVPVALCSKGIEEGTSLLPYEVFSEVLGDSSRLAAICGPNHAEEVIRGLSSGTVIASESQDTAHVFRDLLATESFRCYTSDDVVGVELCAAFKNVIAIAVGLSYGIGNGDNTAAMLMTRGMAEMGRLVRACGGQPMTVMGLAGAGDLIATCTSEHSRNRSFGKLLAQGGSLEEYQAQTHMVVEGALACKTILPLAAKHDVELPITERVRKVVWGGESPLEAANLLVNRPLKAEFWGM